MRNLQSKFGREKLCFLIGSAAAACSAWYLLSSVPVPLKPGTPVGRVEALQSVNAALKMVPREAEESYVTSRLDPLTGQYINRDRENPFAPVAPPPIKVVDQIRPVKRDNVTPPSDRVAKAALPVKASSPPSADLEFTGVAFFHGESIGLLRWKDGSGVIGVKPGSEIKAGTVTYRVDNFEKQAINLSRDGQTFRLEDQANSAHGKAKAGTHEMYDF
jgi:hypothetical protein